MIIFKHILNNIKQQLFLYITNLFTILSLFTMLNIFIKKNFLILEIILVLLIAIIYINFKSFLNENEKKLTLLIIKIIPIYITISLLIYPILKLFNNINSINLIIYMISITTILGFISFYKSELGNNLIEKINTFLSPIPYANNNTEEHKGNIILCKIKDTLKNEVLPYKDRFLHMLILGPTGSGKTSQIILPMIHQDIQNLDAGITVLEPKSDLAQKAAMMAEYYNRPYIYFDPSLSDCPHFNPMTGKENDVVENMATTFRMLNPDSPQYFLDLNEQLVRNSIKVLKRLDKAEGIDGKYSTLINLGRLMQNSGGKGRELVQKFSRAATPTPEEAKENEDIAGWFLNEYFSEKSKIYENCSGVRSQVAKITSNEYLREILNPDITKEEKNEIDFDTHLENGGVICISTAQGTLRELGRFLGYFIILQLQSAVFRRPGDEDTRRPHFLYIDEFQTYSNPGFADMLTQGRSYRVASHLAIQGRAQMAMGGGRDGKNFVDLVSTNARNIILYPGCSYTDAKYYSDQFGEYEKTEIQTGKSFKKFNLFTGGFDKLGHPTETVREAKKTTAVFSPSDLIYRPFGEIVYCIIKNGSIQTPKVGCISYIPKELNTTLNNMITEYLKKHKRNDNAEEYNSPISKQDTIKTEPLDAVDDLAFSYPEEHDSRKIDSDVHNENLSDNIKDSNYDTDRTLEELDDLLS